MVEIKSFTGRSPVYDLEQALGQYSLYRALLTEVEPERKVYLAVSEAVLTNLFDTVAGQVVVREMNLALCAVNLKAEEVVKWLD